MPYFLLSFSSWLDNTLLPLVHLLSRSLLLANALWLVELFIANKLQGHVRPAFLCLWVIHKWTSTFLLMYLLLVTVQWKACAYLRWWVVCELLFAWTGLSLGKRFLGEKGAARHGDNVEQSDPIYTGRHLITISPSVSQVPWFVRAAATVNFNASKALRALRFAQMGQDKVTHLVEHNISSECFAALGQDNC